MHAIKFKGHTAVLGVSQGYLPLAVLSVTEKGTTIHNSYWKPTEEELSLLNKGHLIHFGVLGAGQPPVMVAISNLPAAEIEVPYTTDGLSPHQIADMQRLGYTFEKEKPKRIPCAVCDGTGKTLVDANGMGLIEKCRFCEGGYIDAAN